jgi:hypothetical protein
MLVVSHAAVGSVLHVEANRDVNGWFRLRMSDKRLSSDSLVEAWMAQITIGWQCHLSSVHSWVSVKEKTSN